jgi:hypothetical protein
MSTTRRNIRRVVCLSAGIAIFAAASAIAATQAHADTLQASTRPTSAEIHIANGQPDQLTLDGATLAQGSHWVFAPPEHIAGYSNNALFEAASTSAPGGAQASVTYIDHANGSTVTFNVDAAPYRNGSTASAVVYPAGLQVSGYQGFFAGLHPQLNLHYSVTGTSSQS